MVACSRLRDVSVMKCVCLFRGEGKKTEHYLLVFRLKCMEAVETVVTIICRKCSFLRPYEWVHFTRGRELLVYKFVCILFGPFFVSYLLIRNFMEVNEPVLLSLSAFSFFFFSFFVLSHSPLGAADVPLSGKDAKLPLFKTSFPAKRRAKTVLFNVWFARLLNWKVIWIIKGCRSLSFRFHSDAAIHKVTFAPCRCLLQPCLCCWFSWRE